MSLTVSAVAFRDALANSTASSGESAVAWTRRSVDPSSTEAERCPGIDAASRLVLVVPAIFWATGALVISGR
ncbi:hypothetical protein [Kocuria massiliensis]|uniref:hypothetical protein n=1 Tax=Kocuria massiliensis TaxID=1926282 RepID=UPI0022B95D7A|nr:hypothetical protein [Kocuria massiliensis]